MSSGGSSEGSRDLLGLLEERKKEIRVEIDTEDRLLNPFSAIKVRIKAGNETLHEEETILKCDSFAGCFMCFSRDYSMITFEKGARKLSFKVSWNCLTWDGKPVFEDRFFELVSVGDLFVGRRKNYIYVKKFTSLEIFEGKDLFRILIDQHDEFFTEKLEARY